MNKLKYFFLKTEISYPTLGLTIFLGINFNYTYPQQMEQLRVVNSMNSNISQNSILDIDQDSNGIIWIATEVGVDRYDGINFTHSASVPQSHKGLREAQIKSLRCAANKVLICSNYGLSLITYSKDSFKTSSINDDSLFVGQRNRIRSDDTHKRLFIASTLKLYEFNVYQSKPVFICNFNDTIVDFCIVGSKAYLLNGNGILKYDMVSKRVDTLVSNENLQMNHIYYSLFYNKIICSSKVKGLLVFDSVRKKILQTNVLPDQISITSFLTDIQGRVWIGTQSNGIFLCKDLTSKGENFNRTFDSGNCISSNQILKVFESSDRTIFIGTRDAGLNLISSYKPTFKNHYNHFNELKELRVFNNSVWAIKPFRKDILLLGTEGNGLAFYNTKTKSCSYVRHNDLNNTESNSIKSIVIQNKKITIGTLDGVFCFKQDQPGYGEKDKILDIKAVSCMLHVGDSLFVGSSRVGLYCVNLVTKQCRCLDSVRHYNSLTKLSSMDGFLGSTSDSVSLLFYKFKSGEFEIFNLSSNCLGARNCVIKDIGSLLVDKQGYLWLGTSDQGIYRVSLTTLKPILHLNKEQGLGTNTTYGLQQDFDGNIWVSTNKGLVRLLKSISWAACVYNIEDGLGQNEYNAGAFCSTNGDSILYFGGVNGISMVEPSSENTDHGRYTLLAEISKDGDNSNQPVSTLIIDSFFCLSLPRGKNSIDFKLALLNYNDPKNNQISYSLNGSEFVYPSSQYIHLSTGSSDPNNELHYYRENTLIIKTRHSNGDWSGERLLKIEVPIPKEWFLIIVVGVFLLLPFIWIGWSIFRRNSKRYLFKEDLQQAIYAINSETEIQKVYDHMLNYITSKNIGIDYSIISISDQFNNEIKSIRCKGIAGEICEKSKYALDTDDDILCYVVNQAQLDMDNGEPLKEVQINGYEISIQNSLKVPINRTTKYKFKVIGDQIMTPTGTQPSISLNKIIFDTYNHEKCNRLFLPIIHRANNTETSRSFSANTILGVIEVGFKSNKSTFDQNLISNLKLYLDFCGQKLFDLYIEKDNIDMVDWIKDTVEKIRSNTIPANKKGKIYLEFIEEVILFCVLKIKFNFGVLSYITGDAELNYYMPSYIANNALLTLKSELIEKQKFADPAKNLLEKMKGQVLVSSDLINHTDFKIPFTSRTQVCLKLGITNIEIGYLRLFSKENRKLNNYAITYLSRFVEACTYSYKELKTDHTVKSLTLPVDVFGMSQNIYNPISDALREFFNTRSVYFWEKTESALMVDGVNEFCLVQTTNTQTEAAREALAPYLQTIKIRTIGQFRKDGSSKRHELIFVDKMQSSDLFYDYCTKNKIHLIIYIYNYINGECISFGTIFLKRRISKITPETKAIFTQISKKASMTTQSFELAKEIIQLPDKIENTAINDILYDIARHAGYLLECPIVAIFRKIPGQEFKNKDGIAAGRFKNKEFRMKLFENSESALLTNWVYNNNRSLAKNNLDELNSFLLNEVGYVSLKNTFWDHEEIKAVHAEVLALNGIPYGVINFYYRDEQQQEESEFNSNLRKGFARLAALALRFRDSFDDKTNFTRNQVRMATPLMHSQELLGRLHDTNNTFGAIQIEFKRFVTSVQAKGSWGSRQILDSQAFIFKIADKFNALSDNFKKLEEFWKTKNLETVNTVINVADLLEKSIERVNAGAIAERVTIIRVYEKQMENAGKDQYLTFGDFERLEHAIINIIKNAIQSLSSSNREKREIEIEYSQESIFHVIKISDNGKGVSEDIRDKIFDLFTTFKKDGTGLGLYICRLVIEEAKGEVSLMPSNKKRGGATFVVKLIKYHNTSL